MSYVKWVTPCNIQHSTLLIDDILVALLIYYYGSINTVRRQVRQNSEGWTNVNNINLSIK